jgi:chromosomal replication initiation ATPase DnaA
VSEPPLLPFAQPFALPQPPLPLAYAQRLGAADFILSASNQSAAEWLSEPGRWPMPRSLLVGPAASGKSHLAGMFAAATGGTVIEDADRLTDGEPLFHAWNAATAGTPLLLTARRLPKFWAHSLPDLASRLAATPLVRVDDPDDGLLAAVLEKRFADKGLRVGGDVIAWLVTRIERSFAAASEIVEALDAVALANKRAISVPLARELLEGQFRLAL